MNIGSCHVFTDDHNPDGHLAALKRAGYTQLYTDKAKEHTPATVVRGTSAHVLSTEETHGKR